jgi:hypothetical protein
VILICDAAIEADAFYLSLGDPFFDFMEALPNCATLPTDFVPEDARGWHGTGLWMTQMELD